MSAEIEPAKAPRQGHGRLGGLGARRGRLFAAGTGLDTALGGMEIPSQPLSILPS